MIHKKINKIKKLTQLIKDTTILVKSFKKLIDVIFYIFLMFYIGYDKIHSYNIIKVTDKIEIDNGVDNINQIVDKKWDIDYMGITVVIILFTVITYKVTMMIKYRNIIKSTT